MQVQLKGDEKECGREELLSCLTSFDPVRDDCGVTNMISHLRMDEADVITAEVTAEMALLGLPSSFIARPDHSAPTKRKNIKKRPPLTANIRAAAATNDSNSNDESCKAGRESGIRETSSPLASFRIRSVKLYTHEQNPGLDSESFEDLVCSRIQAQNETTLIDGEGNGGNVPLIYCDKREFTDVDVLLGGAEESCTLAESEDVRWEPVWDQQYECYYFCDIHTGESTWKAPPGYENYAVTNSLEHHTNSLVNTDENTMGVVFDESMNSEAGGDSGSSEVSLLRGGSIEQFPNEVAEDGDFPSFRLGKAEALSEYGEELHSGCKDETANSKGDSLAEIFWPPDITNSHVRFGDSDEGRSCISTGEEEHGEIDWNDIKEEVLSQGIRKDAVEKEKDDVYNAGSPSSTQWISVIHSKVAQRIKASKACIKKRRLSSVSGVDQVAGIQLPDMVEMRSKKLMKYWIQRYSLFTKFDEGVRMDEEGWFSVTPEIIAKHQASRYVTGLVIDAFTGVGGNAIQFALRSHKVIAIDIDPKRIECARHNAEIYGVADKIEYIVGDFFQLAPFLKADLVFLSPPWGGPEYLKQEIYDLHTMLKPKDGCTLFKVANSIAPNIALFVPRNVDLSQLQDLSCLASPPLPCEVEENYVNDKLKAITAYYGEIAGQEL